MLSHRQAGGPPETEVLSRGQFRGWSCLMSCYIIRKIRLAHCKKGPDICDKCREMDTERICLLDICPPLVGEIQRRVIHVNRDGEKVWREFDVVRAFESEEETKEYANKNGIEDVEF